MIAVHTCLLLVTAAGPLLAGDVDEQRGQHRHSQSQLYTMVSKVVGQRLEAEREKWQQERQDWQREKEDWQREKEDWQREKQDWQREKEDWQREKEDWQREKEDWQREKEDWRREKEDWQREKEDWQREKEDWQREKQDWQRDKQGWQREKQDWQREKEDWQREKEDWQREKEDWQREKEDWQREKEDWQREKEDWQREKEDWQREMEDWQREKEDWQREKQDWQREKEDWQREKQDWQREKQDWQRNRTGNEINRTGNERNRTGNERNRTGNERNRTGNVRNRTGNVRNRTGNEINRTGNERNRTGNEKQDWQREKQDWRREKQDWQREKEDWQRENQDWQQEKLQWLKEKQSWQVEKRQCQSQTQNSQPHKDHDIVSLKRKPDKLESPHPTDHKGGVTVSQSAPFAGSYVLKPAASNTGAKTHDRNIRSDDPSPLEGVVAQLELRVSQTGAELQALKNADVQHEQAIVQAASTTFVRWGRSVCPNSTQLVYTGVVGGGEWSTPGSSGTVLCLPLNPVAGNLATEPALKSELFGAEFHTDPDSHQDKDPVCSVCLTQGRSSSILVPATTAFPSGWTLDYSGFLMGSYPKDPAGHDWVCVDSAMEPRLDSERDEDGLKLFYTYTRCGSLPCPPYHNDHLVTCAVCSK